MNRIINVKRILAAIGIFLAILWFIYSPGEKWAIFLGIVSIMLFFTGEE